MKHTPFILDNILNIFLSFHQLLILQVEEVLDEKNIKGVKHYLIRWKGYEEESDTWEPEDTLDCKELIEDFKKKKTENKSSKTSKKKEKKEAKESDWDENDDFEVKFIVVKIIISNWLT